MAGSFFRALGQRVCVEFSKSSLELFALGVALYALFCTVYSDIIAQNGNHWYCPAILGGGRPEINLTDLLEVSTTSATIGSLHDSTYLFVLDVSDSMNDREHPLPDPILYESDFSKVNLRLNNKVEEEENVLGYAKLQLYRQLLYLVEGINKSSRSDRFAVWAVGDQAQRIFPASNETEHLERARIEDLTSVLNREKGREKNTNFVDLFRLIQGELELDKKQHRNRNSSPRYIITIISDLRNDIEQSAAAHHDSEQLVEKNWADLEEEVEKFSNADVMINLLVVAASREPDWQKTIYPLFHENTDWYRLNGLVLGQEERYDFLHPVQASSSDIKLFYTSDHSCESTFNLNIDKKATMAIDLPLDPGNRVHEGISILAAVVGSNGKVLSNDRGAKKSKRLRSGRLGFVASVNDGEKVRLSCLGLPVSMSSRHLLRVSLGEEKKSFLIPIRFVKVLPSWASWYLTFLQIFTLLFLTLFAIKLWREAKLIS